MILCNEFILACNTGFSFYLVFSTTMDGPGTVTWEEFVENAEKFLAVSDKLSDGWELHGDKV